MARARPWLAAAVLAALQGALLVDTAWDKSEVGDEPTYLAAAALAFAHRDLDFNREAPVLPKWGFALGLRAVDPSVAQTPARRDWAATHVLWSKTVDGMRRDLLGARMATILMTILGGLCLWRAASRFGPGPALVTHALWCVSPSILANGALATLDGWVTAFLCVVILAAVRYCEAPGPLRAAAWGAALGLAAACKVTSLAAVPVALMVGAVAWKRQGRPGGLPAAWKAAGAFAASGFLALWAAYLLSTGPVTAAEGPGFVLAPFPQWWGGLLQQWGVAGAGHSTYLFGEVRSTGWWWFYLAALALKTTIGAQALALVRLAAWARRRPLPAERWTDAAILAYPAVLLLLLSVGRTQTGIRYLLPAFPFAMLWAGRALTDAVRAFGPAAGRAAVAVAVLASAAESLAVHPHHLMFFNRWAGGPLGGPRYLILGDDWGQDQRRLGEWQAANHIPTIYYAEYSGMPRRWGINYKPAPCEPKVGVFALQAVEVHRPRRTDPGCLDWLTVEPPDERLGYSIYIYVVDRERLQRLATERATARPFWRSGAPSP